MLKFQNISKTFKTELLAQPFQALNDVSFEIPEGSMVGFLGANGAGKTTSLKIIMDFIRPDAGEVLFDSKFGNSKIDLFRHIGFLPERPYFYPNLTGSEFLHFLGSLSEMKKKEIEASINKWAPRFKIDHALSRKLRTYSKGMLQRIGFMAAILHEPKMIILDEPLSGLDPIGRRELKEVIIDVHRSGKTVFFSSHIVPDIEEICDRVIFLKDGKLVYDGAVDTLLTSREEADYIVNFKNPQNHSLTSKIKDLQALPGQITSVKVSAENKQMLLSELVSRNIEITNLELVKPSLEEIFYQIRN